MYRVLCTTVLVGLLSCSLTWGRDNPKSGGDILVSASYVGKIVFLRKSGTHFNVLQDNGEKENLGALNQMYYQVLAEAGEQIKVRQRGQEGWLAKAEAMPVEEAVKYFTVQIQADPNDTSALQKRGAAWRVRGELDNALKDLDEAIRLRPQIVQFWHSRGQIWSAKKNYDKAIQDHSEAIRLNPNYVAALNDRGVAWLEKKEYDKAMEDFDQAIQIDPKNPHPFYNKACCHALQKRTDLALDHLGQSLELGFPDLKHLKMDSDLDSLRDEPRYKKLVEQYDK